ncbi:MAG: hypothetical protein DRG09_05690 [Epsilonproteobacteria bacterium]|nr:MAG: hypothetical protein DRG09_05690 [Campylobacterota bacterium]
MKTDIIYRSWFRFVWEGVEGLILLPLIFLSWPLSKRWLTNWRVTTLECSKLWSGDVLTPSAIKTSTRAINVDASAEIVWSWIAQFGLGRAGFYSYELLERMIGIPVKNVEVLLPNYQLLEFETEIKLHPNAPAIPIGALLEARYICFGQRGNTTVDTPDPRRSWSIYIEPLNQKSCRLILRSCTEELRASTLRKRLGLALEEPIDFLMEQRMLRTIRRLAENLEV